MPHSRAMGSGLYELRIAHQEGPFGIVLLHAFVKKTERTSKSDLDLARARQRALEGEEG